ncbi:MAG: PAS domain-containing sensor histidine kinase [Synechococcales bacterium]|nr:PAS domain-containing sensor histidine kinase [Synechococcales bacterium]
MNSSFAFHSPNSQASDASYSHRQSEVPQLQQALQLTQSIQQQRLDAIPYPAFVMNPDGMAIAINCHWQVLTPHHPDHFLGVAPYEALSSGDRDRVQTLWQEAHQHRHPIETQCALAHPATPAERFHLQIHPVFSDPHQRQDLVEWFGTLVPVVKPASSPEPNWLSQCVTLLDGGELCSTIFEESTDAILLVDPQQQTICDCNPSAVAMFGAETTADLLGLRDDDLHPPAEGDRGSPDSTSILAAIRQQPQATTWHCETLYGTRQGQCFWGNVAAKLVQISDRAFYLIRITDISDRKQAEMALKTKTGELKTLNRQLLHLTTRLKIQNRELNQFAYVASHDLKAPLRGILSLSEWLEDDLGERLPSENRHQLQLLRNRVLRMESLINGLLDYSRAGRTSHSPERVAIAPLLREVILALKPPAGFMVHIAPEMPTLVARRRSLKQVFLKLISNAIKHCRRTDGVVSITVMDRDNGYEFAVSDNGPGIDRRYHDKVFEIFQTLRSKDEEEATGVGLSIAKKIVHSEGGDIWVESEAGKGTTMRFTWPKQATER